jgi:hypothetical protein
MRTRRLASCFGKTRASFFSIAIGFLRGWLGSFAAIRGASPRTPALVSFLGGLTPPRPPKGLVDWEALFGGDRDLRLVCVLLRFFLKGLFCFV